MAIEMIESNEMSALAPSRLGLKNFVNDKSIKGKKNPKVEENFANLFGSAKKKKAFVASIKTKWASLPSDCDNIDNSIAIIEEDTAALIKKSGILKGKELKNAQTNIKENQTVLGELKKFKIANCAKVEAEKQAQEEQKFQEKLVAVSEASVEKAKQESQSLTEKVKSNKNVLLIGGGIVVLGIIGYFIFKKK
jgi:hypothetical protein